MSQINSKLYLSLTDNSTIKEIDMVQGDTLRGLDIFVSDSLEMDTESDSIFEKAFIYAIKPSGLECLYEADVVKTYDGNEAYEIIFKGGEHIANILAESGDVRCQITLIENELNEEGEVIDTRSITSFIFIIHVQENLNSKIESTREYAMLIDAIKEINEAKKTIEEIKRLTVHVYENPSDSEATVGDLGIFTDGDE